MSILQTTVARLGLMATVVLDLICMAQYPGHAGPIAVRHLPGFTYADTVPIIYMIAELLVISINFPAAWAAATIARLAMAAYDLDTFQHFYVWAMVFVALSVLQWMALDLVLRWAIRRGTSSAQQNPRNR